MQHGIRCLASAFVCSFYALVSQAEHYRVDANTMFQKIDSFGASDAWSMQKIGLLPSLRQRIAKLLFDKNVGIGLSGWRYNLGAGVARSFEMRWIEHPWRQVKSFLVSPFGRHSSFFDWGTPLYNFMTKNAGATWFLLEAHKYGVASTTAFVNSPPRPFTNNGITNLGRDSWSSNLKVGAESDFANYLFDVLNFFDGIGIGFDYLSPVNEPQWSWKKLSNQEGTSYSNQDLIRLLQALDATRTSRAQEFNKVPQFDLVESGEILGLLEPKMDISVEYGQPYGDYLNLLFRDRKIAKIVNYKVSAHSYWSERAIPPNEKLVTQRLRLGKVLREIKKVFPTFEYWMTEFCILEGAYSRGGKDEIWGWIMPCRSQG